MFFGTLGYVAYDEDEDRVQCHLCGEWFKVVGGSHLSRMHGWSVSKYRAVFRIPRGEHLASRGVRQVHRERMVGRYLAGEQIVAPGGTEPRPVEWVSLARARPELAAELDPSQNTGLLADTLGEWSREEVWWRCPKHEVAWRATVRDRSSGAVACPACRSEDLSRMAQTPRYGSIVQRRADLAAQLHPTRNGDLDPETLAPRSHREVWWLCADCGYEWRSAPAMRRGGCPECGRAAAAATMRAKVPAPDRSLAAVRPDLLVELHPTRNGDLDPATVAASSHRKLWWRCPVCGREWEAEPSNRTRSTGTCTHRGARSLADARPDLLSELHPTRNGNLDPRQVPAGSKKKIWWLCRVCGREWQALPSNRTRSPGGCSHNARWLQSPTSIETARR